MRAVHRWRSPTPAWCVGSYPGFTLVELLVVMGLVLLLVVVLLSVQQDSRTPARKAVCGNNQRQIVLAMGVYANENDNVWPVRLTDAQGFGVRTPAQASDWATAVATLEWTVVQTGNQMTAKVFRCLSAPDYHPALNSCNAALDGTPATRSQWVAACQGSPIGTSLPGYCYDWSVPTNADASRVVTADRLFGKVGHRPVVVVCYADNHVGHLDQHGEVTHGTEVTVPADGSVPQAAINAEVGGQDPDNIYDAWGDGTGMRTPKGGSSTRAWVR